MSVSTKSYSISNEMMNKIKINHENLESILDTGFLEEANVVKWEVDSFDYDEYIDEMRYIIGNGGYSKTAEVLYSERSFYTDTNDYCFDYKGINIWIIPPDEVKIAAIEIQTASVDELKAKGIENQVTNYDNDIIMEHEYESYLYNLDQLKTYLQKTADCGNYLLFAMH